MGLWKVIEPNGETYNQCANPSIERATTGWTAVNGSALARSSEQAVKGAYSLETTPASHTGAGVYYGTLTLAVATLHHLSFSFLGEPDVPYKAYLYDIAAGAQIGSAVEWDGDPDGLWRRIVFSVTTHASNTTYRLYIVKNGSANTDPFYVDAVQVVDVANCTYIDGDEYGCRWIGTPHLSRSVRQANTAYGGVVKDLADDFSLLVDQSIDTGMAPVEVVNQLLAQGIGSIFQDIQIRARVWQLVSHLVGVVSGDNDPRTTYHSIRNELIKLLGPTKPDRTNPAQIGYELNGKMVWLGGFLAGGLEKGNLANTHAETSVPLRQVSVNPLWRGEMGLDNGDRGGGPANGQGAAALSVSESITGLSRIIRRQADGSWDNMEGGIADAPLDMVDFEGSLYVARFGSSGGRVEIFDLTNGGWTTLTPGSLGNSIYAIKVRANGNIVVGGGSTAYCRLYNGSSWSNVGTGLNGNVRALLFGNDGLLYATGAFSTAGGGTVNKLAYIDLDSGDWQALDSGVAGWSNGLAIAKDKAGNIYFGGQPSVSGDTVYKWDPVAGTLTGLGLTQASVIQALAWGPDGMLYAGGFASGPVAKLYRYNGVSWEDLSADLDGQGIQRMAFDAQGRLYISPLDSVGGLAVTDGIAIYDGNIFFPYALDLPAQPSVIAATADGSLIFGWSSTLTTGSVPTVNSLTNLGSADTGPIIRATGPGRLYSIINEVGGELFAIYFDLDLIANEEVIIDLRLDKTTVSTNLRGEITAVVVLDGSDFEEFVLQPGENKVQVHFENTITDAVIFWPELHLSMDGVAQNTQGGTP